MGGHLLYDGNVHLIKKTGGKATRGAKLTTPVSIAEVDSAAVLLHPTYPFMT